MRLFKIAIDYILKNWIGIAQALGALGTAVAAFIAAIKYRSQYTDEIAAFVHLYEDKDAVSVELTNMSNHNIAVRYLGLASKKHSEAKRYYYYDDIDYHVIAPGNWVEYFFPKKDIPENNSTYFYFQTSRHKNFVYEFNESKLRKEAQRYS